MLRGRVEAGDRALPADSLILDADPTTLDSDRVAIAGVLLFGGFATGELAFAKKVSTDAAQAIKTVTGREVVSKVSDRKLESKGSDKAIDAPLQATSLHVARSTGLQGDTPGVDETRLGLVPGERYQGALFGIKEMVVASNAWLLERYYEPTAVLLAAGLLFSHDFLAKQITIEGPDGDALPVTSSVTELCSAVGIAVS